MMKGELIVRVSRRSGLTQDVSERAINAVIEEIRASLQAEDEVSIRGFGVLSVRHERPKVGRNPRTGQPITISAARRVRFKASRSLV
jgi:DNA-binding protein HU-beta